MIKINKQAGNLPESLIPAFENMFADGRIPRSSKTTHKRRVELIKKQSYCDHKDYNSRYKKEDIKNELKIIYSRKCAYCEHHLEQLHVEHYRPKDIYYWLTYSWDNLLLACPTCNGSKGKNFDINGEKVVFDGKTSTLRDINFLSSLYDEIEKPKMINPEIIDPEEFIYFSRNGEIHSKDCRFSYTIKTCRLKRSELNDDRRKILDEFKNDVISELASSKNIAEQRHAIGVLVRSFIRKAKDEFKEFIAFRKYAINNNWLREIISEILI